MTSGRTLAFERHGEDVWSGPKTAMETGDMRPNASGSGERLHSVVRKCPASALRLGSVRNGSVAFTTSIRLGRFWPTIGDFSFEGSSDGAVVCMLALAVHLLARTRACAHAPRFSSE